MRRPNKCTNQSLFVGGAHVDFWEEEFFEHAVWEALIVMNDRRNLEHVVHRRLIIADGGVVGFTIAAAGIATDLAAQMRQVIDVNQVATVIQSKHVF